MAGSLGLYTMCFVDYGEKHLVNDKNGEAEIMGMVAHATQANPTNIMISTHDGKVNHGLEDGDTVTFRDVVGMTELNKGSYKIKTKGPKNFELTNCDSTNFTEYHSGGFFIETKTATTFTFKSFKDGLVAPFVYTKMGSKMCKEMLHNPDMCKWERAEQLHLAFQALLQFTAAHNGELPRSNNEDDAAELVGLAKKVLEANQKSDKDDVVKIKEVDAEIISNVARYARAQISPTCSFLGGVVCQEVVKFTGKFTPLR